MIKYLPVVLLLSAISPTKSGAQTPCTGPHSSLNSTHSLAKTTETRRRIIAESKYDFYTVGGYRKTDSTKLEWFGSMSHDRYPTIQPYFTYEGAASNEKHQIYMSDTVRPYTRTLKTYNSNNELVYSVSYNWNTGTATWDSNIRVAYVYMGGKLIQDLSQQKVAGMYWVNRTRNEYSYKAGLLDEKTTYGVRNLFLGDWRNDSKTNYTYTAGVLSSVAIAQWDSSASVPAAYYNKSRLLLTFSGKDTTQKTTQSWDKTAGDWRNVERKSYNFSKGPYSEDLTERWNTSTSGWQNYAKDSLVYSGGLLVNHILFEWISSSKTWGATDVYAFDYTGSTITAGRQLQWDGTKWIDDYLTEYHYDSYNDVSKAYRYKWDGSKFMPTETNAVTYYYYEAYTPTSITNLTAGTAKVNLYPNPARNHHSYLDFFADKAIPYDIQVLDMSGKEVYRRSEEGFRGDHSVLLQLDALSNGVYLVNLSCAGRLQAQLKLVQ